MSTCRKRIMAVWAAAALLAAGLAVRLPLAGAEGWKLDETLALEGVDEAKKEERLADLKAGQEAMQSATITFVKTGTDGKAADTDLTQALYNYNDYAPGVSGGPVTGYWMLLDRYMGMSTDTTMAVSGNGGVLFNPTTSNHYVTVEWNVETRRFEVTGSYEQGARRVLSIPRYGFVLVQYNTFANNYSTFFRNLAPGTEVRVNMDDMVEVIRQRVLKKFPTNADVGFETYEQMLLRATPEQAEEIKAGTRRLRVSDVTISTVDEYVDQTAGAVAELTGSPLTFSPEVSNAAMGIDEIGIYDANMPAGTKLPTSSRGFYIPLAPVEGNPGVYEVQDYKAPTCLGGGAVAPTVDSIPENGYLLCMTHFLSAYIFTGYNNTSGRIGSQRADERLYPDITKYFAPGKQFRITKDAASSEAQTDVNVIVGDTKYDVQPVQYRDDLTAADVQKADAFTAVSATGSSQWTPAFSADNTTEAVVVGGVIVSFGTSAGTYIPANGYVLSASGSKKAALDACEPGDMVTFLNVAKPEFTEDQVLFRGEQLLYDNKNVERPEDGVVLYDGTDGKDATGTEMGGFEVAFGWDGGVVSVGGNNSAIPEGGYVLSAGSQAAAALQAIDFTGFRAVLHEEKTTVSLYRSPTMAAEAWGQLIEAQEKSLEDARIQLLDLPYEDIESALSAATSKLDALNALQDPGADEAKKSAYFTAITAAQNDMEAALDVVARLFIPTAVVESRAVWVQPNEKNEDEVRALLQSIKDANLNTVYVGAWQAGYTSYPSANKELEQMPALDGFDALGAYVEIGHELGLEIRAWVDGLRLAVADRALNLKDPAAYLAAAHPEWLLISRNGNDAAVQGEQSVYYLDPTGRESTALLSYIYAEIANKYDVDGMVIDSLLFPENGTAGADGLVNDFGFNEGIMDAYTEAYGTLPFLIDSAHEEWAQWQAFKATCVNELVYRLTAELKSLRPDLKISAIVSNDFSGMAAARAQDAMDWVEKGYIDELIPLGAYLDTTSLGQAAEIADSQMEGGASLTMGLVVGDLSADNLEQQIQGLRALGFTGTALYGYTELNQGGHLKALAQGVYRQAAQALPENLKDSVPAVLAEIQHRLGEIYAVYDSANEAQYTALSNRVKELEDSLEGVSYDAEGLEALREQVAELDSAVQEAGVAEAAKTAIGSDLEELAGWLEQAGKRLASWASAELKDLSVSLALEGSDAPEPDSTYALQVYGTVEKDGADIMVRLAPGQYSVEKLAGDFTVSDGLVTVGEDAGIRMRIRVADGYRLAVADSDMAVQLSYTGQSGESVIPPPADDAGDGEDDIPDTGVQAVWPGLLLLSILSLAVCGLVVARKRHDLT